MIKSRICATQAGAQQKEDDCPMLFRQGSAPTTESSARQGTLEILHCLTYK